MISESSESVRSVRFSVDRLGHGFSHGATVQGQLAWQMHALSCELEVSEAECSKVSLPCHCAGASPESPVLGCRCHRQFLCLPFVAAVHVPLGKTCRGTVSVPRYFLLIKHGTAA